ncbi:hypothetical protein L596_015693 [Steinernema carpocapsae]|uniref:Uncharacterized protein n=1 Tax=Steinernema carpocapsae TaxID=34508 RepID=A0A4U5NGE0_STECR|nr:hypothetical protein L596_015693 [Steinernema carpocapsae]
MESSTNPQNGAPQESPVVKMRQKSPLTSSNGSAAPGGTTQSAASALMRGMEALHELPPDLEDGNEEIRKLDTQLDHLSDYMSKLEDRLSKHHSKMMETLERNKSEREKKRQSFHERMLSTQQEDDEFQRQLSSLLNRVDVSRNRMSVYDMINGMEVPKTSENGSSE